MNLPPQLKKATATRYGVGKSLNRGLDSEVVKVKLNLGSRPPDVRGARGRKCQPRRAADKEWN